MDTMVKWKSGEDGDRARRGIYTKIEK